MAKKNKYTEGQENYNNSKVFIPENFVGMGNSNKGFNYNSTWGGRWENGGKIQIKNINSNEAELKPARNQIQQFLLNLAGGWEHNKPQLLKDVPILDYAIQPTLDYLAGKGDETSSVATFLPSIGKIKDLKGLLSKTETKLPKNFKSEIDWAKWNPETPTHPELINEYNAIEESTKNTGTWMKNPDGTKFKGTPEQFIQQNSSWYKKAFPMGSNISYRGDLKDLSEFKSQKDLGKNYIKMKYNLDDSQQDIIDKIWEKRKDNLNTGIYTTNDFNEALKYSNNNPNNVNALYSNIKNPKIINNNSSFRVTENEKNILLNEGYDAIINKGNEIYPSGENVVFNSNQLKSAKGNVGYFDMTNPNIYKGIVPVGLGLGAYKLNEEFKNGGEINNISVDDITINRLDSLANVLRNMQYEHTKKFKETYPNIPVEEILNTNQNNKKFSNKSLDNSADSLISLYGDKSIKASPEYINTLNKYNSILQSIGYIPSLEGKNETNLENFGWRAMNYKYTHPDSIPAYEYLEQKTNDDMIRKGAPSKGKYGKKTPASAENGIEMQYYQQGLDFKPKTISKNGSELEKLDQLTNWTNYNIPQAEFGLDATTMMRWQNPEFLNTATSKLNFDFNKAITPYQIQQQNGINNNLLPISSNDNSIMDSLGGIGGVSNTAGKLVQGIQQLGAEKKKRKSAEQWSKVSDVVAKAAELKPEQQERKYIRPEDNINTGSEFFPVYGVGTNVLKDGGEIQNTYAPNTLYKDLEYYPLEAENGTSINPWIQGSNIASNLITSIGGENAGGNIGGTLGETAGTLLGGPIGGAIGKVGGQLIGGLVDRNPHKMKEAQQHFNNNIQRIGMADGVQQQYSSYMEDGGELKYISNDWLPKPYASLDEYRSGGNLKADYIAPTERALQTYALGGDIQTHWGGKAEPISYNPFLPEEGETVMFKGQTHDESDDKGRSGIGVTFGNNPVEVENNEPAVKLNDGGEENNLVVFGNLQIPKGMLQDKKADGRKFKSYIADLSKIEVRQNNLVDNSMKKIDDLDVNTSFDKLQLSSLKANVLGANMKLKDIADKKMNAANLQSAINDTAAEHGLVADDLAKGKIVKAKYGKTLEAKGGKELEKISQEDYDKLIGMYNKAKQQGKGKAVEEFQRAFSNLLPNRATSVLEKYPVTNYGRQQGLPATDLASNYDAIFGQRTEQYLPQIQDALNKEIQPLGAQLLPTQPLGAQLLPTQPFNTKQLATSKSSAILPIEEQKKKGNFKASDLLTGLSSIASQFRPLRKDGLDPRQIAGNLMALSEDVEPVYAQTIQADLSTPYDISLQDMMPRFEAAKRSAANNPAALAQIEAQEQEYKNKVLGEQFRQNQAMKANVYTQNRDVLNRTKLANLDILGRQQDKQALAKSNTEAIKRAAIQDIGDKMLQKDFENMRYNVGMNMNNYAYDANGRLINMNPTPNFNIPTVANDKVLSNDDYLKAKATIKAYDEANAKQVKALSKGVKTKRNGDIVKSFKGY